MEAAGLTSSVIAIVEISAKIASICLKYCKDVKHAKGDILRLIKQVEDLQDVASKLKDLLDGGHGRKLQTDRPLCSAVQTAQARLEKLAQQLGPSDGQRIMKRFGLRSLKWPFTKKEVDEAIKELQQPISTMMLGLQIDQTNILFDLDLKVVFDKLPVAKGAAFDSYAQDHNAFCLPDTRVDVLSRVHDWAYDPTSKSIFWLNGMAGTGKSTISRTVAKRLSIAGHLGASFFFKRGENDQDSLVKFFTTIAADMATRQPSTAAWVKKSLDSDSSITSRSTSDQFEKLLLEPMSHLRAEDQPVVFVIDALDECEKASDVGLLFRLLSRLPDRIQARVFLTSRPELPLRLGFKSIEGVYEDVILHEIPEHVIEHDISVFLQHELRKAREEYNMSVPQDRRLDVGWPSKTNITELTNMAIPLFIFAATVCRFVSDRRLGTPVELLSEVLCFKGSQALELDQLQATYLPVLNKLVQDLSPPRRLKVIDDFKQVIGPILVLATPLSAVVLAELLDMPKETIDSRLDLLHSVLQVPKAELQSIRLLHLSFRDFLFDTNRKRIAFWMDEKKVHADMASKCIKLLERNLRRDLCDLKLPSANRYDLRPDWVDSKVAPSTQYAILYWVSHVESSGMSLADGSETHLFLTRHLLHWVEALTLLGRISRAHDFISSLKLSSNESGALELMELLEDAVGLLSHQTVLIDPYPLQIYYSLLSFSPSESKIRKLFGDEAQWINVVAPPQQYWGQGVQSFEGYQSDIGFLTFSSDAKFLATISKGGTVRLWSVHNGRCIKVFEERPGCGCICFSPAGEVLLAIHYNHRIEIWRVPSNECVQCLRSESVFFMQFSPDSSHLIAVSVLGSVTLWDVDAGEQRSHLSVQFGNTHPIPLMAASADIKRVAYSCLFSTAVQVTEVETGRQLHRLSGFGGDVEGFAFFRDSRRLAISLDNGIVQVLCTDTGSCLQLVHTAPGPRRTLVVLAVSADSRRIAKFGRNRPARIYHLETRELVFETEALSFRKDMGAFSPDMDLFAHIAEHNDAIQVRRTASFAAEGDAKKKVNCIAIPPNSAVVASASEHDGIRLRSAVTGDCVHTLGPSTDNVLHLAFSDDSKLLVSSSSNGGVRLWQVETGECVQTFNADSKTACAVALSHDASLLVTASEEKGVEKWNVLTGKCTQSLGKCVLPVVAVSISPDSSLVAVACSFSVSIWQLYHGTLLSSWSMVGEKNCSVAFSPRSVILLVSSMPDEINFHYPRSGRLFNTIDVGFPARDLRFERETGELLTDHGAFKLPSEFVGRAKPVGENKPRSFTWEGHNGSYVAESLGVGPRRASSADARSDSSSDDESIKAELSGYSISQDGLWIAWKGNKLIRIPSESRPCSSAVSGSLIATGSETGRVTIIKLPEEPPLPHFDPEASSPFRRTASLANSSNASQTSLKENNLDPDLDRNVGSYLVY